MARILSHLQRRGRKKNLNPVSRMMDKLYAEACALARQRASARGYVRGISILLATTVMTDEDRATRESTHQQQLQFIAVCTQQNSRHLDTPHGRR